MSTSAHQLLSLVWRNASRQEWETLNHSMHAALRLAINSGMVFCVKDFKEIYGDFRGGYWVGGMGEWIYSSAIASENKSCIEAFEAYYGREPFRANNVDLGYNDIFRHHKSANRSRERMAVEFSAPIKGKIWHVATFDDTNGRIRLARYATHNKSGKPREMQSLTHEEFALLFPCKKPIKKLP